MKKAVWSRPRPSRPTCRCSGRPELGFWSRIPGETLGICPAVQPCLVVGRRVLHLPQKACRRVGGRFCAKSSAEPIEMRDWALPQVLVRCRGLASNGIRLALAALRCCVWLPRNSAFGARRCINTAAQPPTGRSAFWKLLPGNKSTAYGGRCFETRSNNYR